MPEASETPARYLAPAQVAELLSISVDEVMELVREGRVRGARLGSPARWRIEEASVAGYVDDQVEEARLMHLWEQSQAASVDDLWAAPRARRETF
ncbi:helix-turn-helix domain-containing protein [uncultured Microbacterium sp.]|jgi:excisionase family DNA binding protein|uniref:helix-turn-helix domain-containing protein n=1 Tax=uncultured Microbacterium sp. TaxID=191216 RepID=UPI0025D0702E|nr:helix-turn-helix domain-containing protein [uncultured Microbacterium sp.]